MKDSEKEQIKIRAAYLNGLALIFFGIGGFGPAFAAFNTYEWPKMVMGLVWFWAGGMSSWELHRCAQRYLAKLDAEADPQRN
ncbi:hypothetical protein [Paracoccus denitrificans]|uniref:hypothetical protein n=1 Tax=Paracoccus denitrificans TaxID=266 RepID=UPI001319E326|nr:hypothetical protein [Paracoccus denitrificans]